VREYLSLFSEDVRIALITLGVYWKSSNRRKNFWSQ